MADQVGEGLPVQAPLDEGGEALGGGPLHGVIRTCIEAAARHGQYRRQEHACVQRRRGGGRLRGAAQALHCLSQKRVRR